MRGLAPCRWLSAEAEEPDLVIVATQPPQRFNRGAGSVADVQVTGRVAVRPTASAGWKRTQAGGGLFLPADRRAFTDHAGDARADALAGLGAQKRAVAFAVAMAGRVLAERAKPAGKLARRGVCQVLRPVGTVLTGAEQPGYVVTQLIGCSRTVQ